MAGPDQSQFDAHHVEWGWCVTCDVKAPCPDLSALIAERETARMTPAHTDTP